MKWPPRGSCRRRAVRSSLRRRRWTSSWNVWAELLQRDIQCDVDRIADRRVETRDADAEGVAVDLTGCVVERMLRRSGGRDREVLRLAHAVNRQPAIHREIARSSGRRNLFARKRPRRIFRGVEPIRGLQNAVSIVLAGFDFLR